MVADSEEQLQQKKTGDEEERQEHHCTVRDEHLRMVEEDGENEARSTKEI